MPIVIVTPISLTFTAALSVLTSASKGAPSATMPTNIASSISM